MVLETLERLRQEGDLDVVDVERLTGCDRKTIRRWFSHGVDGVRLEGVRVGDGWRTSRGALERFLCALNRHLNR